VSTIRGQVPTDVVAGEITAWQNRPVDPVYPVLYIDAIRIKVRDAGVVANKAAHLVVGVDLEGRKQVLGVWIQQTEGAKFWSGVLTEPSRNRRARGVGVERCAPRERGGDPNSDGRMTLLSVCSPRTRG